VTNWELLEVPLIFTLGLLIGSSWAGSSSSPSGNEAKATANQYALKFDKQSDELGKKLPQWAILPFVGILLSIAISNIVAPHFWHHYYPKVAAFWALIFALPFIYFYHSDAIHNILHIYMVDYIPFIIMLWALFTIAGGIVLTGNLQGRPIVNTILLLVGTVMASWIGTTGASMIMIRPILRANASRKKTHVICFFILRISPTHEPVKF
jgi:transporter, UIT6 family (TC 9.B.53)